MFIARRFYVPSNFQNHVIYGLIKLYVVSGRDYPLVSKFKPEIKRNVSVPALLVIWRESQLREIG